MYKADEKIQTGFYDVKLTHLDFNINDGASIQEELITLQVGLNNPTVVEHILKTQMKAYFADNTLRIESPQPEIITVYSIMGAQLYSTVKNAGMIEIPFLSSNGSIFFIRGSVIGTVKGSQDELRHEK